MKSKLFTLILSLALATCSEKGTADHELSPDPAGEDTTRYIDFPYSRVIAFATITPFDHHDLITSGKMNVDKLGDTICRTLNDSLVKELVFILDGNIRVDTVFLIGDCFIPRHAIVFLNKEDSIVNYISVSFECNQTRSSKIHKADFAGLTMFFNSIGLKAFHEPELHSRYYGSLKH